jgi:plasmid maintenance system antidote protein VapI
MGLKADIVKALRVSLDKEDSEHLAAEIMDRLPPVYAVAPEMLESLQTAWDVLCWAAQESTDRVKKEVVGGWIHHALKINSVIAKAEGQRS